MNSKTEKGVLMVKKEIIGFIDLIHNGSNNNNQFIEITFISKSKE
jgi:hypothetical protein